MTNPPAGSNPVSGQGRNGKIRATVHGHTLLAAPELIQHLRRQASATLGHLFLQAKEQGSAPLTIDDQPYTITRLPDHTFTVLPGDTHRFSL